MHHLTLSTFAFNFHGEGLFYISTQTLTLVRNIIFIKSQPAIKQTSTFKNSIPILQGSSKGNNKVKYEKKNCSLRGRDLIKRRP